MEKIYTLDELPQIAAELLSQYKNYKIWTFFAAMGAGKTTLIAAIGKQLNWIESVQSPTFSLIHEYNNSEGFAAYHYDFYRIKNIQEAKELGIEEQFASGSFCVLEWAENILELLPIPRINIYIEIIDKNKRKIWVEEKTAF